MVKIPLGQCLQIPGDVVDKLMVWVGLCAKLLSIEWGWVQAQHDSKKKDWISQLNDNMDAGAKEASGGRGLAWRTPEVWTEIGSVFLTYKGRLVVNHKKFLQGYQSEHLRVYRDDRDPMVLRPWTHHMEESVAGLRRWQSIQPLPIKEFYPLRAWARYALMPDWELPESPQVCKYCNMEIVEVRVHHMHACPDLRVRIWQWMITVVQFAVEQQIDLSRVALSWGGVVIKGRVSIRIIWSHPAAMVEVHTQAAGKTKTWPVVLGMAPILGIAPVLSKLGVKDPVLFMYKVMDSALRTYKGHRRSTHQAVFVWPSDWVGGANGGCIVGYGKPPTQKHVRVAPELMWCLRSMMVVNTKSPVIHTLVWQDQTYVSQWHRRVPSQWVGGGGRSRGHSSGRG